ncbi:MAG: hypothetical protein LBR15_00095 [Methanobrevibacter sp.]|jgi:hypothetical protein|nr:hypothetical protein [Candidatus Methanovirga australis]
MKNNNLKICLFICMFLMVGCVSAREHYIPDILYGDYISDDFIFYPGDLILYVSGVFFDVPDTTVNSTVNIRGVVPEVAAYYFRGRNIIINIANRQKNTTETFVTNFTPTIFFEGIFNLSYTPKNPGEYTVTAYLENLGSNEVKFNVRDNEVYVIEVYVSNSGNDENSGTMEDPVQNLKRAVELVNDGGTIEVLSDLNVWHETVNVSKNVTIRSKTDKKTVYAYDCQIFNMDPNVKVNVTISNLKLTNGYSMTSGGAIFNNGSDLNLYDCVIDSSTASNGDGGGVFITGGGISHIVSCSFTNNRASNRGGGISITNTNTRCYISDCNFTSNRASSGGGLHSGQNNHPPIFNCNITNNHAELNGGGVYVNKGMGNFTQCNISNNDASDGGGVNINEGVADFLDCNITFNSASDGGGVSIVYGTGDITACEVSRNNAVYGGGIKNGRADYYHGFCTIGASNLRYNAASYGGGIYNDNTGDLKVISLDTPDIKNKRTSLYYNKAGKYGGGIYDNHGKLFFNGTSIHYNSVPEDHGLEGGGISSFSSEVRVMFDDQSINHMSDNTPHDFEWLV